MWLFTRYGFFSAVCRRSPEAPGGYWPETIAVRARQRRHLEALMKRFPEELGSREIVEGDGADYPVRIFVPKPTWASVASALAGETDYHNFKDEVLRVDGRGAYEDALHAVWGVMFEIGDDPA